MTKLCAIRLVNEPRQQNVLLFNITLGKMMPRALEINCYGNRVRCAGFSEPIKNAPVILR